MMTTGDTDGSTDMLTDELRQVILQTAELLEYFKREGERMRDASAQSTQRLEQMVGALPGIMRQSSDQALAQISGAAVQTLREDLREPVERLQQQLLEAGNKLGGITHSLSQQGQRADALTRRLLWLSGAVGIALATAVIASAGLLWHYQSEIGRTQVEADLLRAYNQADVRLCDDQLCARPAADGKRYGSDGEYMLVAPR